MHTAEDEARLVAAVVDQLIKDATANPARYVIRAHRLEAEQAKRDALRDLRSMARHPERWPLLAFLCEHVELSPEDVLRGLYARAGLPWQRALPLPLPLPLEIREHGEAGELAA